MKELEVMDAQTLLYHPLEKPKFILDGLIPSGLSLFCGSQKIGKSWLMLRLCLQVSRGLPMWDIPTTESEVLYLCLEDTFYRIQERLFKLTDEANAQLHFAISSNKLTDGLVEQLEGYMAKYPETKLIVIDTLQKVRADAKDNSYASDYGDIWSLSFDSFSREYKITMKNELRHVTSIGTDIFGNIQRLDNLLGGFEDRLHVCEEELENSRTQLANAKEQVQKPFPQEDELKTKSARLDALNIMLNMDKTENEIVDDEREEDEPDGRSSKEYER